MIVVEGIVGSQANSVDYEDSKGNWVQYPPIELVAEAGKGDDGAGIKAMDMTNETSPLSYETYDQGPLLALYELNERFYKR